MLKNLRETALGWSFHVLSSICEHLPTSWSLGVARALGSVMGYFDHGMKRALQKNIHALLHSEAAAVDHISAIIFRNFAITLHDFFFPAGLHMEVPEREKLEQLRREGKGIMLLTFHMGHWELGARVMSEWGWPVTAVYQPYTNKKLKDVIEKRRAPRVNFIPVGGRAATGVREALQRGDVVAMLGDHPFGEDGMPVKLLGHHVIWPKGPVVLAVKEMVPIVVAVIVRTASRRYRAVIEDPLYPRAKTRVEVDRLVQEVADKFGKLLKEYPLQWYRFRPFEFVDSMETAKEFKDQIKIKISKA